LQVGEPSDWMGPVPVGLAGLALWVMALTGARLLFQRSKVGPQATGSA